jgi:hypothetical protein
VVREPLRDEQAAGQVERVADRRQELLVARFGDQQRHIGMGDVTEKVLVPPGVVDADDSRPRQGCAAEGEEVFRRVVEQDADVKGASGVAPGEEQVGPSVRLGDILAVGPDLLAETHRGVVGDLRIGRVPPQERGRVRRRHRSLARRGNVLDSGRARHLVTVMPVGSVRMATWTGFPLTRTRTNRRYGSWHAT